MSAPWLVAIDLQHVFADPASPWASPDADRALRASQELVATFEDRVVLTRFEPDPEPRGSWADYYRAWPFALEALERDPRTYDLLLDPGDAPVLTRPTMGKYGPDLLRLTGGSRDLVLCGVATDCCVLSTALAAADDGAWVRVVADACAGSSAEAHERSLAAMAAYAPQVEVLSAADLG
ncbi:isochorismatase [Marmoricola endophyticus]|uniref:Isochorismatase n=1 Tax=Marmoricola endophyticus TaxID=2040280 RepID=A0A917BVZ0_9ACTN|nr:cysteine hydrolase [Marmoricola endophyticus]GGF56702.1 isochorismatase [Marmoricola endophyticus]